MSQTFHSPARTEDVVAIYDGYSQVFRDARPMRASIRKDAGLMEHPTEDGGTVIDHMAVQPTEIELSLTLLPETGRKTYRES